MEKSLKEDWIREGDFFYWLGAKLLAPDWPAAKSFASDWVSAPFLHSLASWVKKIVRKIFRNFGVWKVIPKVEFQSLTVSGFSWEIQVLQCLFFCILIMIYKVWLPEWEVIETIETSAMKILYMFMYLEILYFENFLVDHQYPVGDSSLWSYLTKMRISQKKIMNKIIRDKLKVIKRRNYKVSTTVLAPGVTRNVF